MYGDKFSPACEKPEVHERRKKEICKPGLYILFYKRHSDRKKIKGQEGNKNVSLISI